MSKREQFWKKSWDEGLTDMDPRSFEMTIIDIVTPTFKRFPKKVAQTYMGTEITFRDLDRYANRFADMLIKHGLKKGDVVGINLPNTPEYTIAWLGALRAGCVVSGVSPLLSTEETEYQLKDSNAKALVTLDAIFAGRLTKIADRLPDLKVVAVASIGGFLPPIKRIFGTLLKKFPTGKVTSLPGKQVYLMKELVNDGAFSDKDPGVKIAPGDLAYIQYTGGTTGLPKGAMLSHRNIASNVLCVSKWFGWERGDGAGVNGFPFFHIAGIFVNAILIYLGLTQSLIPNPRNTDHITAEITKYRPRIIFNVPALYQLLMANPKFGKVDHSSLEVCISGASPFPEESQKEFEAIVGRGKLIETFGMSETSPLLFLNPYRKKKKLGSIGLPVLNTDVKLVDPATGKEVGIGQPGEMWVKGPQVMSGYYKKPEENRNAFDKDGYFRTGDVSVMDDEGYLRVVDRTKDMIIVSGFKVFSVKVEGVLTEHPAIDMIATVGVPNPERPGSEIVKAFVQLKPEHAGDDREALKKDITAFAKEKLTPYEVPKVIEFMDALPLTAVGKLDKKKLRK
jgi:long-chain acyl-CoA synthetase